MKIILELSDHVVMQSKQTMSRIFYKILATGRPVTKTLIKYNSNNLEEKDEEEKEALSLLIKKQILIMMRMLLTLNDHV